MSSNEHTPIDNPFKDATVPADIRTFPMFPEETRSRQTQTSVRLDVPRSKRDEDYGPRDTRHFPLYTREVIRKFATPPATSDAQSQTSEDPYD